MRAYPKDDPKEGVIIKDLQESITGDTRPILLVLLGAAGVVLLIACADISGLILARVTRRQREMAIRAAIGAARWHIFRQLLTESILLSILGGALGLWLATLLNRLLPRVLDSGILASGSGRTRLCIRVYRRISQPSFSASRRQFMQ